jgi:two-component system, NtrC family, sensor histidine kinase KinB
MPTRRAMISLRHKLWLGFGTLLLILLAVSVITAVVLTRYSHGLEKIFRENYDSALYCDEMKAAIDQINVRALYEMWNPAQADQIDVPTQIGQFQSNLQRQIGNITLPGEAEHTYHLADLWTQYQAALKQFEALDPKDRPAFYGSTLLPLFNQIHQTSQWIASANINNMVSINTETKRALTEVRTTLLILTLTGTLAAAIVVGAAGTSILHPLSNLTRSARQIERGDLDLNLAVRSRDEIGALAEAFNSMAAKLREFRKLDHDRLQRTQQTTQLAIDSLPDAVFVFGPTGIIEISNRTARTHFGVEPGLAVTQLGEKLKWLLPLYDAAHNNRQPAESTGYRSAVQLFDNGEERFLLPHAVPMFSADGQITGVSVILADITRLRSADEAKSSLVSTVSHELRTPLTSIRMALNLLTNDKFGPLAPKQVSLLEAARQDSDRLYRIIENLLSISRIESGTAQFQFRAMSPAEIISGAAEPMRSAFADKKIKLEITAPADLPQVSADPVAIASAITNLLSNALKFTPAGGTVTVSASLDHDRVAISVADTGPGIPDEYAGKIFEKFFRVPAKDGPTGAGLGLAIAKDVVEAHGGTIELVRTAKIGAEFRILLPAAVLTSPPNPLPTTT